jgi:hypothetical protein
MVAALVTAVETPPVDGVHIMDVPRIRASSDTAR